MEQFANNASTTLSGTINNSVTSLTVASASGFPSSGNFRIIIDSEIMLVTAVSGTTFTITRAQEGTTAASHTSGATITHILTSGALTQFRGDSVTSDVIANLPTAGFPGRLYLPTDEPVMMLDNGSSWDSWLLSPLTKLTPPPSSGWSWVNQGSASVSQTAASLTMSGGNTGFNMYMRSYPTTPWKIDICAYYNYVQDSTPHNFIASFAFMDNTNKFCDYEVIFDTAANTWGFLGQIASVKYTTSLTFSSLYFDRRALPLGMIKFIRIADDGTNRSCSLSADGQNFVQIHSVANNDYVTPTKIGFGMTNGNPTVSSIKLIHWYLH